VTPNVRVLWRRGAILRVEADPAEPDAYLRGVAEAIGLTGVDFEAWTAAVLAGGSGLIGLRLRDAAAVFHEHDLVELVREMGGVPAGTRGVVVGVYGSLPAGYEVECRFGADDKVAVITVGQDDIRLVEED
jgi:hypothetical protein